MTAQTREVAAETKWLEAAEDWGAWVRYPDDRPGDPEWIYMRKSGSSPEVRFYAIGKGQVGAEHKSVVAATYWAYANGWLWGDGDILFELACRAEVLAGGAVRPS